MLEQWRSISRRLYLPTLCALCNQSHSGILAVCTYCMDYIHPIEHRCKTCAMLLPDGNFPVCGACIKNPPAIDACHVLYDYEEPLRTLMHRFKYQNHLHLLPVLGHLMLHSLQATQAQCLIPVPLHPKRLNERGFNQAALLARWLGKKTHLPVANKICYKIQNTSPQASLDRAAREKNLAHAFKIQSTSFERVMLIDDLITTGTTSNELAKKLKEHGVTRVELWCCARA